MTRVVQLPISKVTLFEDRGHVARSGRVPLTVGSQRIRIEGVAPTLSDKTVFATCADAGVRIVHARVERVAHADRGEQPQDIQALDLELRDANREFTKMRAERQRLVQQQQALAKLAELTVTEISESAAHGQVDVEGWTSALDTSADPERRVALAIVTLDEAIEEARRSLQDLKKRRQTASTPSDRVSASIVLDVVAETASEATVGVDYIVPGACWRPYHRARLVSAPDGADKDHVLSFQCDGCVWQNTGEPWDNVELAFSTERLSLGASPPLLETDTLSIRKRSSTIAVQHRDRTIETTGLGSGRTDPAVPGIDDGGDVLSLPGRERATVPSDGHPYRVPIFAFDTPAETALIVVAERAEAVIERSRQSHAGAHPILAGPVDLIRDNGIVGRSQILFVAPGERFELGFGPDPSLRVSRDVEQLDFKETALSTWLSRRHNVRLHLSNLGAKPRDVEVLERIPVSEIDKVEIHHHPTDTTDRKAPDQEGMVRWRLTLPAKGGKTVKLSYTMRQHPDVVGM